MTLLLVVDSKAVSLFQYLNKELDGQHMDEILRTLDTLQMGIVVPEQTNLGSIEPLI